VRLLAAQACDEDWYFGLALAAAGSLTLAGAARADVPPRMATSRLAPCQQADCDVGVPGLRADYNNSAGVARCFRLLLQQGLQDMGASPIPSYGVGSRRRAPVLQKF